MKRAITINEDIIKKAIRDTLNEAGFRKFAKPMKPNAQKKGNLQIAYCKTDKKMSAVTGQEK